MKHLIFCSLMLLATATACFAETPCKTAENSAPAKTRILDLESACRIAVANNPTLAAADARVRAAAQRVRQASAAWFPSIDASATASRVNMSRADYTTGLVQAKALDPAATLNDPEDYYAAGIRATWLVFNGFERRFTQLAARHGESESIAARRDARRLLLAAVAETFFAVQLARENIAIAEADKTFNERLAGEAKIRRDVGTGPLSDVLNFEVQTNAARTALITAKSNHEAAMAGLAALLGYPKAAFPEPTALCRLHPETAGRMQSPDPSALIESALSNRPDLSETRARVRQADAAIGVARAGYFPDIAISGTLNGDRAGDTNFGSDDFGNAVELSVTCNLFAGGITRARVAEAKQNHRALAKAGENLKNTIAAEVRQALARLSEARQQLALQRENARLVRENRDLVEKEYRAGQTSLVRLNEAQRDLVRARSRLAQARVSLDQAWYTIDVTTGRNIATFTP